MTKEKEIIYLRIIKWAQKKGITIEELTQEQIKSRL